MKINLNDTKQDTDLPVVLNNSDEANIYNQSDIQGALIELNKDKVSGKNNDIDLRARLHPVEVSSLLALDSLVALGFCPIATLAFSTQKKRLSISLSGLGRKEIIDVVSGHIDREEKKSGFKQMFNLGQK